MTLHGVWIKIPEDLTILTEDGDDAAMLHEDLFVNDDPDPCTKVPFIKLPVSTTHSSPNLFSI